MMLQLWIRVDGSWNQVQFLPDGVFPGTGQQLYKKVRDVLDDLLEETDYEMSQFVLVDPTANYKIDYSREFIFYNHSNKYFYITPNWQDIVDTICVGDRDVLQKKRTQLAENKKGFEKEKQAYEKKNAELERVIAQMTECCMCLPYDQEEEG